MSTNIKIFGTLIAVSFLLIAGIVLRYTGAADVATTAEIQNTAPTVDTIRFATSAYSADDLTSTGVLPNVGTTRTIHINGIIHDKNGEDDIASSTLALVFHKTTSTNACTADNNDCYRITTCDTNYTDGDDTQIAYNCEVPIQYFIDATDAASIYAEDTWTAYIEVEDFVTAQGTLSATIEVNSLLALNLPDAIDYGTRSLGEVSSSTTNIETTITQRGNTKADVQVSGGNIACTVLGSLATSTQAWALTSVGHSASTILTDALVATERNIDIRTDESNELDVNLYWNIAIPASGVKGTCTGSNTIAIVAQTVEQASLIDGRIKGVRYVSESDTGFTGGTGNFVIKPNETTSFYIGNVLLGSISYEDVPQDRLVFLQDLLGLPRTNVTDAGLLNRARFIQSLAEETNLTGATTLSIPSAAHTNLTASIDFATVDDTALQTEVQKVYSGRTLRTVVDAQEHLTEALAVESTGGEYTVSTSVGNNTTISPSSLTVSQGNTATFTVSADAGYALTVTGCNGTLSGTTYTTGAVTSDCVVTTSEAAATYTVTPVQGANVTMTPNTPQTVNYNTTKSFTFSANAGYTRDAIGGTCPTGTWNGNTYTTGAITTNCTIVQGVVNVVDNLAAGSYHSLAIKSDGTLWASGDNASGRLGLGDNTDRLSPTQVGTLTTWSKIAAGYHHSLAIKSDGTLWAWGYNVFGQLGLGDDTDRLSPTQVGTLTTWSKIAVGHNHSLAIRPDGTLWAWGINGNWQLGLNDTTERTTPTQVGTLTTWSKVVAGFFHSIAIKSDGTLWGWGDNVYGQLGLSDATGRATPTQVGTLTTWSDVAAGNNSSLAI